MRIPIISFVFLIFYSSCSSKGADTLLVVRNEKIGFFIDFRDSVDDTNNDTYRFFKRIKNLNKADKMKMIKELLNYRGDLRKCSELIINYNKNLSQFYMGDTQSFTIQVQALFLINQIYFDNPFYYSPYPILVETESREEIINDSSKMNLVFDSYQKWFDLVLQKGFSSAKKENLKPLDYSKYKWIYGIDIDPDQPLQFNVFRHRANRKNDFSICFLSKFSN